MAFHLLSPGSRPYFSQAILQSAAATNPWAMVTKKEAKLRARRLAEILDCPYEDVRFHRYYSIHTKPYGDCVFCSLQDFVLCDKTFVRCILWFARSCGSVVGTPWFNMLLSSSELIKKHLKTSKNNVQ